MNFKKLGLILLILSAFMLVAYLGLQLVIHTANPDAIEKINQTIPYGFNTIVGIYYLGALSVGLTAGIKISEQVSYERGWQK